jgi:hypothetical protein
MHTRSQAGRVRGYQPTLDEFNELLALSQKGIDCPEATAKIRYQQGSEVTTSGKGISKIEPEHLSKLIEESGNPERLINFKFSAKQKNPSRRIEVTIRPDGWTYYEVASSDFTWALGRFHELTEKLLTDRRLTAKAQFPLPQVVTPKQYWAYWGGPLWTSVHDRRVKLVRLFKDFPAWLLVFILGIFVSLPPSHALTISFAFLALAYVIGSFGYLRWMYGTYNSYVSITHSELDLAWLITDKNESPLNRASLLVTVIGVVVGVLAFIVSVLR